MIFSVVLLGLLAFTPAGAQTGSSTPTPSPLPSPSPTNSPTPVTAQAPKVRAVEGHLELDDIIRVEIDHFPEWATTNDPTKLVPFINGRAIRGTYPEEIHPDKNRLHFHLEITPENKEVWTDLLGTPKGTHRPVTFSVGLENQSPFDSVFNESKPLPLTIVSPVYGVISVVVVLVTLILFLWLARTTNLIREPGACPVPGKLRPYNLGRAQMSFWFLLIYASYVVIWLITDALDTITPSLLGLMGISAGTALGEALIDSGKLNARDDQLQSLTGEKQSLEQSIPDLQSQVNGLNSRNSLTPEDTANRDSLNKQLQDNRARLAQITQQIQNLDAVGRGWSFTGFSARHSF